MQTVSTYLMFKPCSRPVGNLLPYIISEFSLAKDYFAVSAFCASGYTGTAVVTVCPTAGAPEYNVTGCSACVHPPPYSTLVSLIPCVPPYTLQVMHSDNIR